jgi:glycosyltransferase involved in cell wall biosynthesis
MVKKNIYQSLLEPLPLENHHWGDGTLPLVSISCIAYNHKEYIHQAIDGFLKQKTTFPVEVLIHDDASTDGTTNIIREYEKKFPKLILPIYQTENQYMRGVKPALAFNFPRARGKYIALCEGDDYWTDPLKLQKQIEFLEANPDHVLCFHKIKTLIKDQLLEDNGIEERYKRAIEKNGLTTLDLLEQGNFIHTCSVVFRNKIPKIPFEYNFSSVGDYFFFIILSELGLMHRIDEHMGVYRRGTGIYSSLSALEMQRKIVQYHIAILSYLSDEKHKKIFLPKTLEAFSYFEKNLIALEKKQKEKTPKDKLIDGFRKIKLLFGKIFLC